MALSAIACRRTRLRLLIGGVLWACGLALGPTCANADEGLEASVKAAYLYKFLAYVEWPASAFAGTDAPQLIGVMGDDAVLAELEQIIAGRTVNGHAVAVRRLAGGAALDGLHVLHLGRGIHPATLGTALAGRALLVVTDMPAGLPEGSALNFVNVGRRLRFEASQAAAERAGIRLSARLLAVAEKVVAP